MTVYDRPGHLDKCLASLKKQNWKDFEVIVSEDIGPLSRSADIERVCRQYGVVHLQRKNRPKVHVTGLAVLMNMAAKASNGDILILFNSDLLAPDDFVIRMTAAAIKDPLAVTAAASPRVNRRGKYQPNWLNDSKRMQDASGDPSLPSFFMIATSMTKALYMSVGGFDEDFVGYGYEDWDLGYRLTRAGGKYVTVDEIVCEHMHHEKQRWNWEGNSARWKEKLAAMRAGTVGIVANKDREWGVDRVMELAVTA